MPGIEHVSDTALLVAAARAVESERDDPLVRDPFARRVAGEKGMALLERVPAPGWIIFAVGLRSHFIDDLLAKAIQDGADTVLCLGAGLDTRAWRLGMPPNLRWIEVDFPEILGYKHSILIEPPSCRYECIRADLNEQAERQSALALLESSEKAVLLTEGLLMYLPEATVRNLAYEARNLRSLEGWILDISSDQLRRLAHGDAISDIENVRSESGLDGKLILEVLEMQGWQPTIQHSLIRSGIPSVRERAEELGRAYVQEHGTLPPRPPDDDPTGVWLLR